MRDQVAETVAGVAHKVTYGGGATALWGAYTASEIAAFGGLLIAIAGFVVNYYFKRKTNQREVEYHTARMARLDKE